MNFFKFWAIGIGTGIAVGWFYYWFFHHLFWAVLIGVCMGLMLMVGMNFTRKAVESNA